MGLGRFRARDQEKINVQKNLDNGSKVTTDISKSFSSYDYGFLVLNLVHYSGIGPYTVPIYMDQKERKRERIFPPQHLHNFPGEPPIRI